MEWIWIFFHEKPWSGADNGFKIPTKMAQNYKNSQFNPISGRLLATPISGKGGLFRTPLDISGSYRPIFKIQTAFVFAST